MEILRPTHQYYVSPWETHLKHRNQIRHIYWDLLRWGFDTKLKKKLIILNAVKPTKDTVVVIM